MKKLIVSVRDLKADYFLPPFVQDNLAVALRSFGDAVNNCDCGISKHPEDFGLYQLGTFDPATGLIEAFDQPKHLSAATDHIKA